MPDIFADLPAKKAKPSDLFGDLPGKKSDDLFGDLPAKKSFNKDKAVSAGLDIILGKVQKTTDIENKFLGDVLGVDPESLAVKALPIPRIGEKIGNLEAIAGLVSQAPALITSGLTGSGQFATNLLGITDTPVAERIQKTQEALTFEPRTKIGKEKAAVLAIPLELIGEGTQFIGDKVFESGQNLNKSVAKGDLISIAEEFIKNPTLFPVKVAAALFPAETATAVKVSTELAIMALGPKILRGKPAKAKMNKARMDRASKAAIEAKAVVEKLRGVGAAQAKPIKLSKVRENLGPVSEDIISLVNDTVEVIGGKAITKMWRVSERSPTMRKYTNKIEPEEVIVDGKPAGRGGSYTERVQKVTGKLEVAMEDAVTPLRKGIRGASLPKNVELKLVKALKGIKVKLNKAEKKAFAGLRKMLDDGQVIANEGTGLKIGYVDNFYPRVYRLVGKKGLRKRAVQDDFQKNVLEKNGIEQTAAEDIIRRIINEDGILESNLPIPAQDVVALGRGQITKTVPVERPTVGGAKLPGRKISSEKKRPLDFIPEEQLLPFVETDLIAGLRSYITQVAKRAEHARIFGPDGGKYINDFPKIVKEAAQAGKPLTRGELARMIDLPNAMQNLYRPFNSPVVRRVQQGYLTYQYTRTLLFATVSSATEPLVIFMRGRTKSNVKAFVKSLSHAVNESLRTAYKGLPEAEVTRGARQAGVGGVEATADLVTERFGIGQSKTGRFFFKAIGLAQWTRYNRVFGFEAGKAMIIDNLKDLSKPKLSKRLRTKYTREVLELGIKPEEGINWVKRGAKISDPFFDNIITGGVRFTNEVVMMPRAAVRPMWHSNPHFALVAQLKGFQTTFGNTVLKRLIRESAQRGAVQGSINTVKNLTVMSAMTMTAMMINELRDMVTYLSFEGNPRRKDETMATKFIRGFDRAGLSGSSQFVWDSIFAHRFGTEPGLQVMGVTVSQVNNFVKAVGKAADGDPKRLKKELLKAFPVISSLPGLRKKILDEKKGTKP